MPKLSHIALVLLLVALWYHYGTSKPIGSGCYKPNGGCYSWRLSDFSKKHLQLDDYIRTLTPEPRPPEHVLENPNLTGSLMEGDILVIDENKTVVSNQDEQFQTLERSFKRSKNIETKTKLGDKIGKYFKYNNDGTVHTVFDITYNGKNKNELLKKRVTYVYDDRGKVKAKTVDEITKKIDRGKRRRKRQASSEPLWRWPYAVIPYVISPEVTDNARTALANAAAELYHRTCVRLTPKLDGHQDYVTFFKGDGCYSTVGRSGGEQKLSLGENCGYHSVVVHELLHTLGIMHEQSRIDRDSYVTVNFDNVKDGMEGNFKKHPTEHLDNLDIEYDYTSVMHYHSTAFSKNGLPTIVSLTSTNQAMGNDEGLSEKDVETINTLYSCPQKEPCIDESEYCPHYPVVDITYCDEEVRPSYAPYFLQYCKKTCNVC